MFDFKAGDTEGRRHRTRVWAALIFVLFGLSLLGWRMYVLQVQRYTTFQLKAESNRLTLVPIPPTRGQIVDRNGVVLATNFSAQTLEVIPAQVDNLKNTIAELGKIIAITPRDISRFERLRRDSRNFEPVMLRSRLTDDEVAQFAAQKFRFPGVTVQARLFRQYPMGAVGAHVIGYIGRISQRDQTVMEDSWTPEDQANYRGTDHIGKKGIEQSYEKVLHGTTGFEEIETTASGYAVRKLRSQAPIQGEKVQLSIDIRLQEMIERLFGNRRGAAVVLDPRNGEVLAMVSNPTFDPNLFVDGIDYDNWNRLNTSLDKPLLNRAIQGLYPPGSTYKPFMAMAALITGKRTPSTTIMDRGVFVFGNHRFRSVESGGLGPVNMTRAIIKSSNVYFYSLANEMGVDLIHDQLSRFGFGQRSGIDLRGELTGVLPSTEWKRRTYRRPEQQRWFAGETISLGIGQGYNNFTPLQVANAASILASGGLHHEPRVAMSLTDPISGKVTPILSPSVDLKLPAYGVKLISQAMYGVTQSGTSTRVFVGAPYRSAGKTGTAQAADVGKNEKYNAARVAERKRDHAWYMAFAPLEAPRVAVAVIVENAGFGALSAAPIARRIFDFVLLGRYPNAADMAATQRGRSGASGGYIPVDSVSLPQQTQLASMPVLTTASGDVVLSDAPDATPAPLVPDSPGPFLRPTHALPIDPNAGSKFTKSGKQGPGGKPAAKTRTPGDRP